MPSLFFSFIFPPCLRNEQLYSPNQSTTPYDKITKVSTQKQAAKMQLTANNSSLYHYQKIKIKIKHTLSTIKTSH